MAFTREDAEKKCMDLGGKQYLEVKWRMVWFRETCPAGTIDTEEVAVDLDREVAVESFKWVDDPARPGKKKKETYTKIAKGYARFKAIVTDGNGARATGTKSECAANFDDYIEKAETGAIGRALAALGYGTQFTGDELDEGKRIVDSPVKSTEQANGHQSPSEQIGALLDAFCGADRARRAKALREALDIAEGPLPAKDEYTPDDVLRVDLYVKQQKASAGAGR